MCSAVGEWGGVVMFELGNSAFVKWLLRCDKSKRKRLVSKVICKLTDLLLYAVDVLYFLQW